MTDFADILKAASLRESSIDLCVDGKLNAEHSEIRSKLAAAKQAPRDSLGAADDVTALQRRLEDIRAQMVDHTFTFRFRALPAKAWSDLRAAHRPDDPAQGVFDQETFPKALIVSCAIDPEMTDAQVGELFEVLNEGQRDALFGAAWEANQDGSIPFSLAASELSRS